MRRAVMGEAAAADATGEVPDAGDEENVAGEALSMERYTEMSAYEQFILTISEKGYGKRTSSYEYRITGRGGKGITAMAVNSRNGQARGLLPGRELGPDHAGHR